MEELRVHSFIPRSRANGPGVRCVLHLSGCSIKCPGCFNQRLWDRGSGAGMQPGAVVDWIAEAAGAQGLTLSGGEPMDQARALAEFLGELHSRTSFPVIMFTGYTRGELEQMPGAEAVLQHIDAVIAGRYIQSQAADHGLRGSSNQTLWLLTDRYEEKDFDVPNRAELIIAPDGKFSCTGFPSPELGDIIEQCFT